MTFQKLETKLSAVRFNFAFKIKQISWLREACLSSWQLESARNRSAVLQPRADRMQIKFNMKSHFGILALGRVVSFRLARYSDKHVQPVEIRVQVCSDYKNIFQEFNWATMEEQEGIPRNILSNSERIWTLDKTHRPTALITPSTTLFLLFFWHQFYFACFIRREKKSFFPRRRSLNALEGDFNSE